MFYLILETEKYMIDNEIQIIISDMLYHTQETLKFLRNQKTEKTNEYLDDIINYTLSTEEDILTIERYIYSLEVKLYEALYCGDINE